MTSPVVFRRAARREFDEAALWYEERRAGLGSQFISEINHAIKLVVENPRRFPIMHREIRCARARRFPYSVFFERRHNGSSCWPCFMRAGIQACGTTADNADAWGARGKQSLGAVNRVGQGSEWCARAAKVCDGFMGDVGDRGESWLGNSSRQSVLGGSLDHIIIIKIEQLNTNQDLKASFCVHLAHTIESLSEASCRARHRNSPVSSITA